jgi:hypothetical protein
MRLVGILAIAGLCVAAEPWRRHTIDNTSRGADGTRLAGLDIVTGWEEGGVVRAYRYPGPAKARQPWPSETVGRVGSPEDAVFVDLDRDGKLDVVSASEGKTKALHVHWAPDWHTEAIPASSGRMQWMFSAYADGRLYSGGKNAGAELGWWEIPSDARRLEAWKWHPLRPVGWIMSIVPRDMDGDGDTDLLFSDRRGPRSGVYWLEAPSWKEHTIGAVGREVMFVTTHGADVIAAVKPREIHWFRRTAGSWKVEVIPIPAETGGAKGVRVADLDGDGAPEIVFSCESTPPGASGVMYLKRDGAGWRAVPISASPGVKYDLVEVADLDKDGDLDVITSEETTNLGVIWFENPAR